MEPVCSFHQVGSGHQAWPGPEMSKLSSPGLASGGTSSHKVGNWPAAGLEEALTTEACQARTGTEASALGALETRTHDSSSHMT